MKIIFNHLEKTGGTTLHFLFRQIFKENFYSRNVHKFILEFNNKFDIISIRNPLNIYKSLYLFGCEKKGALYNFIKINKKKISFYDCSQEGYVNFLKFIYKEHRIEQKLNSVCGLVTQRFLRTSLLKMDFQELILIKDYESLKNFFLNKKKIDFVIKNESLISDLEKLILYFEKKPELDCLLKKNHKENFYKNINTKLNFTSEENNIKINNELLPVEIKNLIFEKEKLIFELFYPEILKDNY
jgi:hypothetical protein